jgi:hypothetical protein
MHTPLTKCLIASRSNGAGANDALETKFTLNPQDLSLSSQPTSVPPDGYFGLIDCGLLVDQVLSLMSPSYGDEVNVARKIR